VTAVVCLALATVVAAMSSLNVALPVMPSILSTITETFPREQRTRAVRVWATVTGGPRSSGCLSPG
jgi:hypothetical protein